jgi:hypothetical protein
MTLLPRGGFTLPANVQLSALLVMTGNARDQSIALKCMPMIGPAMGPLQSIERQLTDSDRATEPSKTEQVEHYGKRQKLSS